MEFHAIHPNYDAAADWDALAAGASFYHTRVWLGICGAALQAEAILLCLIDNGNLIAGMPGIITTRLGFKSFHSMPFGTYGGIAWKAVPSVEAEEYFLANLDRYFKTSGFAQIHINDFYGASEHLNSDLFRPQQCFTQILSCPDGVFGIPKKASVEIAAGEQEGGEVIVCRDAALIDRYIELYHLTDFRHGIQKHIYSKYFLTTLFNTIMGTDCLYWNGILFENRLVASQVHFFHGSTQIYWQAVSHPDFRQFRPDYRLLSDAIACGLKRGIQTINLGASPEDADGLIAFKKRWGGERQTYNILSHQSRLYSLLRGK